MPQFRIRENEFEEIKKKILVKSFIAMITAITAGLVISYVNTDHNKDDINVFPFIIPLMVAFMGYRMYTGTKRLKHSFDSYQLTIRDSLITREQVNLNPLSISAIELKEIIKKKDGGFTIKGLTSTDIIYVPAQMDKVEELEFLLSSLHPVTVNKKESILQKYSFVLVFITIGLMLGVYTAANKIIVAISGTLFIGLFSWCIYEIQRSKNVDARIKRTSWVMIIVVLSVILAMITKLAGPISF